LCIAAQSPVAIPAPIPKYKVLKVFPEVFPVMPQIPWPPVRVLNQNRMRIEITNAPVPTVIEFFDASGFSLPLPVTGVWQVSPNEWELTTPNAMVPHLLPGSMGIVAVHTPSGLSSNIWRVTLP
jgi:hypothetical protein